MDEHIWSLHETAYALAEGRMTAERLITIYLERIKRLNPGLHAFIQVSEHALDEARDIDHKRRTGQALGPLAGIPIAIKDLLDTENMVTTYGGLHYRTHLPQHTATAVHKLAEAGAIVLGKTNLHEYAYGTTNENPHYGNVPNPWNRSKIPGGSSGGSAVAVAAGMTCAALGTDTGGSIRIPAALCGLVGMKPSFGLVSKFGCFPLAHSLDHVGPMTRTVEDARLLLHLLVGYDSEDADSVAGPVIALAPGNVSTPIRVGVPKHFFFDKCHPGVRQIVHESLQRLAASGHAVLEEIEVPGIDMVPDMQTVIIASEAYAVHEEMLRSQPSLYGSDVRNRLESATRITGTQYVQATAFRKAFAKQLDQLFERIDVIATPTTPLPATDIGQTKTHLGAQEVQLRGHLTRYTNPWNLSGLPAISIPCGLTGGLPVGLQLVSARYADSKLLDVAQAFAGVLNWRKTPPETK